MTTGCHLRERDRDGASGFLANTLFILLILPAQYHMVLRAAEWATPGPDGCEYL
jgi:hypothetical protein